MDGMPIPCLLRCQTAYGRFDRQLLLALYIVPYITSIASLVVRVAPQTLVSPM